jgi:hypothetical protein
MHQVPGISQGDIAMMGAIRKRDILAHPLVTIRSFGWRVFFKTLLAGRNKTFLAILMECETMGEARVNVPELVQRCVKLERSAQRVYAALAERFADQQPVRKLLLTLSHQEQGHAELLEVCQAAAQRSRFAEKRFAPWQEAVPRLERQMQRVESSLDEVTTSHRALQLVLDLESSEINHVFLGVVGGSDSEFVRRLNVFWNTGQKHTCFIADRISELEPDLAGRCDELRRLDLGASDAPAS